MCIIAASWNCIFNSIFPYIQYSRIYKDDLRMGRRWLQSCFYRVRTVFESGLYFFLKILKTFYNVKWDFFCVCTGQFSSVTAVELEFILFKPSNLNKITHFIWHPLNFERICSKEDSIQVRTLFKLSLFRNRTVFKSGLYSSQASIGDFTVYINIKKPYI